MNAIVTGATKGIGKALVELLAANNFNVALCARNSAEIETFVKELREKHPALKFFGQAADLEVEVDVAGFAAFVQANLKNADVLINNAGLFIPSGLMQEDDKTLSRQMKVNVYTPHYLSKFFVKNLVPKKGGHIFNICSIASLTPLTACASYSITKSALLTLTKLLREELIHSGIKVTAVLPGATLTDSWSGTTLPPERFVLPRDVANAVLNCLSMSAGANVDEIVIRPLQGEI
ncbi:SDR family NAD(P)-dependent oxidoreductase [Daejeonella lutea]|uniref:Short-chain dehydrogenase n=1 Tax=Daejeonella lutea TaxID=572036 RepID=A0A1T5ESC8_9SPHI|nr:SDR family oxidoreductase [Daejeonella lutea]SKB86827.1 Short-chain dehydrogenase [Daejeonella lutea]